MRLLTGPAISRVASSRGPLTTQDLLELYAVDDASPLVRANMVVSLDGRTTSKGQVSGALSSAGDRSVFSLLRSLSDVVLVGAGTVRAEGYRPARVRDDLVPARLARGRADPPVIAVVSRSLTFDIDDPLYARGRTVLITDSSADDEAVERAEKVVDVIRLPTPAVDLRAAVRELRARGLVHVLAEGGPHLLGSLIEQDVLDDLCLSVAPTVIGGSGPRLLGSDAAIDADFTLAHVIEDEGFLLTRYLRNRS